MNKHIVIAKWKQIGGRTKMWWRRLTHNKRQRFSGRIDLMMGDLQEKLGYSRQKVSREFDRPRLGPHIDIKVPKTQIKILVTRQTGVSIGTPLFVLPYQFQVSKKGVRNDGRE